MWYPPITRRCVAELVFDIETITKQEGTKVLRTLVDTGCRIRLLCKPGVFSAHSLEQAKLPLQIMSADGSHVEGGTHGIKMALKLPINRAGRGITITFPEAWCWVANITSVDLIIGYPYLQMHRLLVDTGENCLRAPISHRETGRHFYSLTPLTHLTQLTHNTESSLSLAGQPDTGASACRVPLVSDMEVIRPARTDAVFQGSTRDCVDNPGLCTQEGMIPAAGLSRVQVDGWSARHQGSGIATQALGEQTGGRISDAPGQDPGLDRSPALGSPSICHPKMGIVGLDHPDCSVQEPHDDASLTPCAMVDSRVSGNRTSGTRVPRMPTGNLIFSTLPCSLLPSSSHNAEHQIHTWIPFRRCFSTHTNPSEALRSDTVRSRTYSGVTSRNGSMTSSPVPDTSAAVAAMRLGDMPVAYSGDSSVACIPGKFPLENNISQCDTMSPGELLQLGPVNRGVSPVDDVFEVENLEQFIADSRKSPTGGYISLIQAMSYMTNAVPEHALPVCRLSEDITRSLYVESESLDPTLADEDWTPQCNDAEINKLFYESCTDGLVSQMSYRHYSAKLHRESFTVTDAWFEQIVQWSDLTPTIDVFASRRNKRLDSFWTQDSSAFMKSWKHDVLWMNPPFSKLNNVLEKILQDEAQGILLVPLWPSRLWFQALSRIAVKWWDLPKKVPIFQTEDGKPLPPRSWTTRAVVFNAIGALNRKDHGSTWYCYQEEGVFPKEATCHKEVCSIMPTQTDIVAHLGPLQTFTQYEYAPTFATASANPTNSVPPQDLSDTVEDAMYTTLYSVISSTAVHPQSEELIQQLKG